jgi:hypothetical protein
MPRLRSEIDGPPRTKPPARRARYFALALLVCGLGASCKGDKVRVAANHAQVPIIAKGDPIIRVAVDDRVELLSVLGHIAGFPEYVGPSSKYVEDIDATFAPFKGDNAVTALILLRTQHRISHDALASFAVHLDANRQLVDPIDLAAVEPRWRNVDTAAFARLVREFATTSKFDEFLAAHSAARSAAETAMRKIVAARLNVSWFDARFGVQAGAHFNVVPGLVIGSWNFGPRARRADGGLEYYQILGVPAADGVPVDQLYTTENLPHELLHSYLNPVLARHADALAATGDALLSRSRDKMNEQAYMDGSIVLSESLVRAASTMYIYDTMGDDAGNRVLAEQVDRGFVWTPVLLASLRKYGTPADPAAAFDAWVQTVPAILATEVAVGSSMTPVR